MDCRDFEDRLDVFEAGALPDGERQAAETHLHECDRCRALLRTIRGESRLLSPESEAALARSIIGRTTGPACGQAAWQLCGWVEGDLNQDDAHILSLHLDHCSECSRLAASLRELAAILPEMAQLEPGEAFTAEVLQATSGKRFPSGNTVIPRDLTEWWNRLIRRPRFAWEAAYVGALLALLAFGNPAAFPQYLPSAAALPQSLIRGRDRVVQQATGVILKQREAAERSLGGLRRDGQSLLETAADFGIQTTSALRQRASSLLEELRLSLSPGDSSEEQRRNLR